VTGRGGNRCKQLLDKLKRKWGCWKLKEEALDHTVCRTGFGGGCGLVVRQTVKWMSCGWDNSYCTKYHYHTTLIFGMWHHVLNMYWTCTEYVLNIYWSCTEYVLNIYWTLPEHVLNIYWTYTEDVLNIHWTCTKHALNLYWTCTEHALNLSWICTENALKCTDHVLNTY
jgi:hypothetical protein